MSGSALPPGMLTELDAKLTQTIADQPRLMPDRWTDVMIDLETMGTGPTAAICAIGAVMFSPKDAKPLGPQFYEVVDLRSSVDQGGTIDADTVLWWLQQSDAARAALTNRPGTHIAVALSNFYDWMRRHATPDVWVWGNGADFDNVILEEAFGRLHRTKPWNDKNNRCYRTVKSLHSTIAMNRSGTHHDAIHDAFDQAQHLLMMIGGGR